MTAMTFPPTMLEYLALRETSRCTGHPIEQLRIVRRLTQSHHAAPIDVVHEDAHTPLPPDPVVTGAFVYVPGAGTYPCASHEAACAIADFLNALADGGDAGAGEAWIKEMKTGCTASVIPAGSAAFDPAPPPPTRR